MSHTHLKKWTPEEDRLLRQAAPDASWADIGKQLKRSTEMVRNRYVGWEAVWAAVPPATAPAVAPQLGAPQSQGPQAIPSEQQGQNDSPADLSSEPEGLVQQYGSTVPGPVLTQSEQHPANVQHPNESVQHLHESADGGLEDGCDSDANEQAMPATSRPQNRSQSRVDNPEAVTAGRSEQTEMAPQAAGAAGMARNDGCRDDASDAGTEKPEDDEGAEDDIEDLENALPGAGVVMAVASGGGSP